MSKSKKRKKKPRLKPSPTYRGMDNQPVVDPDDDDEREEVLGTREASYIIDQNTVLYYFNYIGEVCMGHCIHAVMDDDLGPEMAWLYMANVNDNFNREMDVDPISGGQIGPFDMVKKSSEVYLYDPTISMDDFMPTEWWKYATNDSLAGEGG